MSYEMKDIIKTMIDNNEAHWSADTMDMVRVEIHNVYAQAAKADELQKQIGILSGKLDTLKINLNYYEKQSAKTEEHKVKANLRSDGDEL